MTKSAIAAAALLLGCNTTPPELFPPPFGSSAKTRLFFPTGLAQTSNGLLVANSNVNRAFETGTVVQISSTYIQSLLAQNIDCDVDPATLDQASTDACYRQIPSDQFTGAGKGAVMIGNYAGPLALSPDQTAAFTASRDTGTINAVRVRTDGTLGCLPNAGDDAARDCRKGIIDLTAAGLEGPYTIVPGDTIPLGTASPLDVLFVSSIVPHIESISSGQIITSTSVAALSMPLNLQDPVGLLFQMRAGSEFVGGGHGVGPMVFDRSRRRLYLGGCFQRFSSLGSGEPGTGLCFGIQTNYLRIVDVDAGSAADPILIDLRPDVQSIYTTQLLLDTSGAPVTPASPITTLWATMRSPDALVTIDLPAQPAVAPRVRKVIPLPASPADMIRIDRAPNPPLLAVVAEKTNAVSIVDTGTSQIVAQVGRLGDSPFNIAAVDCPATKAASACLAVSVFRECRVALIEVPKDDPSRSALRALAGSCP